MNYRVIVILMLVLLGLVLPVIAAGKLVKLETPLEIGLEKPITITKEPIEYAQITGIIISIQNIFNPDNNPQVEVKINDKSIAVIPADSKFNGIEVTSKCLVYQYGTEGWYDCEQRTAKTIKETVGIVVEEVAP